MDRSRPSCVGGLGHETEQIFVFVCIFVSSERGGNIFYGAAENLRNLALIATAAEDGSDTEASWDEKKARVAIRKLYDEAGRISGKFSTFLNDLLPLILRPCRLRKEPFTSSAVSEPGSSHSIVFVDEDRIVSRGDPSSK